MTLHNDSRSQTHLTLSGAGFLFRSRFQSLSLIEEMPHLDLDADGILSPSECEAGQRDIVRCLVKDYRFGPDGLTLEQAEMMSIQPLPRDMDGFGFPKLQEVAVEWRGFLPGFSGESGSLLLAIGHFQASSPGHRERLMYDWNHGPAHAGVWLADGSTQPLEWELQEEWHPGWAVWQSTWQGGAGLSLLLALVLWLRRGDRARGGLVPMGGLCLAAAAMGWVHGKWILSQSDTTWFLPLALAYVLADTRLGGRWLVSTRAPILWGMAFGIGFRGGAGWRPEMGSIACSAWAFAAAAGIFGLAFGWSRFAGRRTDKWIQRWTWFSLVGVCLFRLIRIMD